MSDIITVIAQLSALTFILTSMLAMGLSLMIAQIVEPLKDARRCANQRGRRADRGRIKRELTK